MHPIHIFAPYFSKIHSNVTFPPVRLFLPSGLLPSGFPTKILYAFIFPMRATCPAYSIILDLTTLIIFGESHKLWVSYYAVFSSLSSIFYTKCTKLKHNGTAIYVHPYISSPKTLKTFRLYFVLIVSRYTLLGTFNFSPYWLIFGPEKQEDGGNFILNSFIMCNLYQIMLMWLSQGSWDGWVM
jgi:hypothetical protein